MPGLESRPQHGPRSWRGLACAAWSSSVRPGLALALACASTRAAFAAAPAAAANPAVSAGSVVQVVAGLGVVLALVVVLAWLLKRSSAIGSGGAGQMRIVGGVAVGQRERIVLVEIGATWLLVGVAPGQVRTLHTMARSESELAAPAPAVTEAGFASWLRRMSQKRGHE